MATTSPEDVKNNADAFAAGFNEPDAERKEQSEDDAFGLNIDAAAAEDGASAGGDADAGGDAEVPVDAVVIVADADTGDKPAGEGEAGTEATASAEPAAEEPAAAEPGGDEPTDPKDIQRKKSWEGRLRAEEERLKRVAAELEAKASGTGAPAKEAAGDAIEEVAQQAEAQGNTDLAQQASEVADAVESGDMSVDEAVKMLAEDFGEPFVKMIEKIAAAAAKKIVDSDVSALRTDTQDIIDHLKSGAEKAHFQAIQDAHPDFADVAKDPAFAEWKAQDPERERIASGGSAQEINTLLSEFKAQGTGAPAEEAAPAVAEAAPAAAEEPAEIVASEPSEDELDAAEGVRSAGMQLPEEPEAASDNYAGAWEEFERKDRKAGA